MLAVQHKVAEIRYVTSIADVKLQTHRYRYRYMVTITVSVDKAVEGRRIRYETLIPKQRKLDPSRLSSPMGVWERVRVYMTHAMSAVKSVPVLYLV